MQELSSLLDVCLPALKGDLVFLDYPVYDNVGDLLIWAGEKAFFKRNRCRVISQYSIGNIGQRARRDLDRCSTICFQGGGNFGDLWPQFQKVREEIVQQYPHKRIVIMPQSVHFESSEEFERSSTVLRAHPDLHIFVRDKESLRLLAEKGFPNVKLSPDMAHALWGRLSPDKASSNEPFYLLRRDKERAYLPPELEAVEPQSIDWRDLRTTPIMGRAYWYGVRLNAFDGGSKINNRMPALTMWNAVSDAMIRKAVRLMSRHEHVVTNRLHAMILASLLERKVIAYDNSYGKLSNYVDSWMSELPGIELRWSVPKSHEEAIEPVK